MEAGAADYVETMAEIEKLPPLEYQEEVDEEDDFDFGEYFEEEDELFYEDYYDEGEYDDEAAKMHQEAEIERMKYAQHLQNFMDDFEPSD